jgi:cytochrome bd-type quinol oxidase subunit 2
MAEATHPKKQKVKSERLWWVTLVAAVVAVIGNIIVQQLTLALFTIPASFPPFNLPPIILFTVVGVVGAAGVFALLGRTTERPIRWFWIISLVVLLLSFIPNIALLITSSLPGTTVPGVISLMIMHVVPAAASVGMLIRMAAEQV